MDMHHLLLSDAYAGISGVGIAAPGYLAAIADAVSWEWLWNLLTSPTPLGLFLVWALIPKEWTLGIIRGLLDLPKYARGLRPTFHPSGTDARTPVPTLDGIDRKEEIRETDKESRLHSPEQGESASAQKGKE